MGFLNIILVSILLTDLVPIETMSTVMDIVHEGYESDIQLNLPGGLVVKYNESDCTVLTSVKETRFIPYTETYRVKKWGLFYKTQTRVNYKIDYTTTWVSERRCCDGYENSYHFGVESKCVPVCSAKCVNADCVSPETCKCHPGYTKQDNPDVPTNVCVPECTLSCTNGKCTAPNTCSCDPGYELSIDKQRCLPICTENCQSNNAHCSAPNNCTCNHGYEKKNTEKCEPICSIPCVNGECVAPDTCNCTHGYGMQNTDTFACTPICKDNCVFGKCTAPDTCTCDPGYEPLSPSVCQPICSVPCVMGKCIAPESCSCNDGYGTLDGSSHTCVPICEKACMNGVCTSPGVCTCNEGYRFNDSDEEERMCKPYCKIPCEPYGTCDAPDSCTCFGGYRKIDVSKVENDVIPSNVTEFTSGCVPICNEACVNGKCSGPDQCSCDPGYRPSADSKFICQPFCDEPCGSNSSCTSPNVCTCDHGFNQSDAGCVPLCVPACSNGTCVATNTCQCHDGFVRRDDGVCVPNCEDQCKNGECVAPNVCRCHDGFTVGDDNVTCTSTCTRNCSDHGICRDTETCECYFGWSGENCDKPTICILMMYIDDADIKKVTVRNETNGTLVETTKSAPYCYQCKESLDNETLCNVVQSNDTVPTVSCFLGTDLPCYMAYKYERTFDASKVAGPLVAIGILIMTGVSMTTYFLYRKHQRKRIHSEIAQRTFMQEAIANELLLTEEEEEKLSLG